MYKCNNVFFFLLYTAVLIITVQQYPLHTIDSIEGEEKERRTTAVSNWSVVIPEKELPCGLLGLCRRTLGSERHRYAIA